MCAEIGPTDPNHRRVVKEVPLVGVGIQRISDIVTGIGASAMPNKSYETVGSVVVLVARVL